MRKFYMLISILFIISLPLTAGGSQEGVSAGTPDIQDMIDDFRTAAASEDPGISAAGYYNLGTGEAMLAEQAQDPREKEQLLEDAYGSLKRAVELDALPQDVQSNARKNLEVVNSRLKELQEKRENQDSQNPDSQQQDQNGDQNSGQQPEGNQDAGSEPPADNGGSDPGELLDRQREITRQTEQGENSDEALSQQQKDLQEQTSNAAESSSESSDQLEKAASEQEKAAQALSDGDRDEALEHQKAAEQALAQAATENEDQGEAEDILDMESEYEAMKNRLDKTGGISNADKDW